MSWRVRSLDIGSGSLHVVRRGRSSIRSGDRDGWPKASQDSLGYRRGVTEPRDPAAPLQDDGGEPRLIAERYRLGPVIGRGGMATIHRATDTRLDREVAVKLLRPEVSRDRDLAQRFRREALAATVLRHPNIVACLDTGTDGDQPFLVMDLVDGEDLAARLRRGGRLAPAQVARIGLDIARGLGVAHLRGIVHRDIKPGNILLAADGRAMVADFGIARLAIDAEAALPGTTLGSVHYFSPEQARGLTTTPSSDVYGLGLVLYEALTGRRAWSGDTTDAIALARVGAAAPSPSALIPDVPAALEAVVVRALAPEAGDRYPNGASMATALEPIVASLSAATTARVTTTAAALPASTAADRPGPEIAPPLRPTASAVPSPPLMAAAIGSPASQRSRRSTSLGVAVAVLAIAGGIIGALLVAALPGDGASAFRPDDSTAGGLTSTERPSTEPPPTQTPEPTAEPTPDPTATPEPTEAQPTVPPGEVADLCESFLGLPCGLGAGRYAPSRFDPAFDIELGDGWSTALHDPDLVSLTREQGSMTFAARVTEVYPGGDATEPRDKARDIIEAFVVTDGVSSTRPAAVRIDRRRGLSVDLTPLDSQRVTLFATASATFSLEPDRTTRLVALDVRGTVVLLAIEPSDRSDLDTILDTADVAAGTIRWR
jgi:eukaryotic-like serine/threonine-protein kinase